MAKGRRRIKTPLPVVLLIIAFLCPTELSLYLGSLRIPPHRLALLLLLPIALWRLFLQRGLKLRSFDIAFVLFNIWTVAIFMHHQGQTDGAVYGGSLALEGLGSYLVARVWIRDVETFHATLRAMMLAIGFAALVALPETLLGRNFTHDILQQITGYVHPTAVEKRLGLTRAYGLFDHPIHYGTFCAALMALFWFGAKRSVDRHKRTALLCGATFLGLSSAPILCLLLQAAMLVWEKVTRGVASRTTITLAIMAGLYIGASCVMSRSPINLIATGMTLDSWTGYYRLQIWEHGLNNVSAAPWTGIGLADWQRPWWMVSSTVDAFWLVIAMRTGVPAIVLLGLTIVLLVRAIVRRGLSNPDVAIRQLSRGWIMSLVALSLVGATVHYWNVLYAYFFFFLGLTAWIADPSKASQRAAATARHGKTQQRSPARRYGQRRPSAQPLPPRPPSPSYPADDRYPGGLSGPLPA